MLRRGYAWVLQVVFLLWLVWINVMYYAQFRELIAPRLSFLQWLWR